MDYPRALAEGWPIATGVIEGACRHLVHDRMGITGARWSLEGAQAMLWLRAINASGDTSAYWDWHITQEHQRNHLSRYQDRFGPRRLTLTPEEPHPRGIHALRAGGGHVSRVTEACKERRNTKG